MVICHKGTIWQNKLSHYRLLLTIFSNEGNTRGPEEVKVIHPKKIICDLQDQIDGDEAPCFNIQQFIEVYWSMPYVERISKIFGGIIRKDLPFKKSIYALFPVSECIRSFGPVVLAAFLMRTLADLKEWESEDDEDD